MNARHYIVPALSCALLWLAPAGGAHAHGLSLPQLIEVYVTTDSLKVVVSSATASYREAQRLKKDHDADRDGKLSADEMSDLREALARRNTAYIAVGLDGRTLTLKQTHAELHTAESVGSPEPVTLHIEYALPFKLGARPRKLVVSDKPRVPRAGFFVRVIPGAGVAVNGATAEVAQRADDAVTFEISRAKH